MANGNRHKGYESEQWKRVLHFYDGEFKAFHKERFYLNAKTLEMEWRDSITTIRERKKLKSKSEYFQCAFPARYQIIKKFIPEIEKYDRDCMEFESWKSEIGAKALYIVYTSSYLSNPASMFGHSFFRLSRGGVSRSDVLDDYTVGFLAQTNPEDNSLTYTLKGISGGYLGFFDIKPFYQNVGLYQNSEARDLWQYKIDLSKEHLDLFVAHLYELSLNTGFKYYFFDENCSSVLLRVLQVVDSKIDFFKNNHLFAHPIETLKWAKKELVADDVTFYPSINDILRKRLVNMNDQERQSFKKANRELDSIESINSVDVLDALIDYWKYKNYKKSTKLSTLNKERMNRILKKRASLKKVSSEKVNNYEPSKNPLKFHDPNKLDLGFQHSNKTNSPFLNFSLGYQDLLDNYKGHDNFSFIDYLGFTLFKNQSKIFVKEIKLFEIISLSPYVSELKSISWELSFSGKNESILEREKHFDIYAGAGLSKFFGQNSLSFFVGAKSLFLKNHSKLLPYIKLSSRVLLDKNIFLFQLNHQYFKDKIINGASFSYSRILSDQFLGILQLETKEGLTREERIKLSMRTYF